MRHPVHMAALVLIVLSFRAGAQPTSQPNDRAAAERALFAAEDRWARALIRRDGAEFDRLIAPDWIYSDERGTMGKRQAITEFTTGADTVTDAGNEGMRAHVYGTTAVVTGILWTKGHSKGVPFQHRYRYTDTWLRLGGRWQCIASQDYDMPLRARG